MGATMHTWSSWRACLPRAAPSRCAWRRCPSWSPRWLRHVPGGSALGGPSSRRIPATACCRWAAHTALIGEHTSLPGIGPAWWPSAVWREGLVQLHWLTVPFTTEHDFKWKRQKVCLVSPVLCIENLISYFWRKRESKAFFCHWRNVGLKWTQTCLKLINVFTCLTV